LDGKRAYFKGRTSASQADDVPAAVIAAVETPNIRHSPATLERPEWVVSGLSQSYQLSGRFRVKADVKTAEINFRYRPEADVAASRLRANCLVQLKSFLTL